MTLDAVLNDAEKYLDELAPMARPPEQFRSAAQGDVATRIQRLSLRGVDRRLELQQSEISGKPPVLGKIIDAHFLSDPTATSESGRPPTVLCVSVLCSAYFRYRVRLRVLRNQRDVDHDGDSDINPHLFMNSGDSAWLDLGSHTVVRSPRIENSLPRDLSAVFGDRSASVTKLYWLYGTLPDGTTDECEVSFGDPLGSTMADTKAYWQLPHNGKGLGLYVDEDRNRLPRLPVDQLSLAVTHQTMAVDRTQPLHIQTRIRRINARDRFQPRHIVTTPFDKRAPIFDLKREDSISTAKAVNVLWRYKGSYPILEITQWPFRWTK